MKMYKETRFSELKEHDNDEKTNDENFPQKKSRSLMDSKFFRELFSDELL